MIVFVLICLIVYEIHSSTHRLIVTALFSTPWPRSSLGQCFIHSFPPLRGVLPQQDDANVTNNETAYTENCKNPSNVNGVNPWSSNNGADTTKRVANKVIDGNA